MKMQSLQLGEINYEEKDIIFFKKGLYGFEEYTDYVYIQNNIDSIFSYLQSTQNPSITFIVVNGYEVVKDFELQVSKEDLKEIEIKEVEDICSFLIVTVPKEVSKMTVNLLGPLVINTGKRIGKQMISLNQEHTTKHFILNDELTLKEKIS